MKAGVYYRNSDVRVEERPEPKCGDRDIIVKIMACGLCGSDLLEWYRIKRAPLVLGHEPAGGETTENYDDYLGRYIANFGLFKDTIFTVLVQNGRLAVDVPGQMVYELKEPDEEGKWYFAVTDQIAVSFDRDEAGDVTGMKMYQAGLTFELPREGVEIPAEIPLEELQKYLGSYRLEEAGVTLEVLIQNNRLAVDIPGEMAYELYPPDEQGLRYFRATPEISVRFNETPEGQVESLSMFQGGQEIIALKVESTALPTVDEIMSLRNAEGSRVALEAMGAYRVDSTV